MSNRISDIPVAERIVTKTSSCDAIGHNGLIIPSIIINNIIECECCNVLYTFYYKYLRIIDCIDFVIITITTTNDEIVYYKQYKGGE